MKKFVKISNALIISLLALLGFAFCKTQQSAVKKDKQKQEQTDEEQIKDTIQPNHPILLKYGVPPALFGN